ncbi:RNA polymerase sigma factor [Methylomonas sp. UP202]|uniref:RNA polymerase sigma factor n=1 Tax=Methylomonas sp. UP202 TaxID=3040943 RepID=UPI00247B2BF6|nr:RNA polymerase sigma factor [Methylomonas sp. UP202]WGS87719.1 RNA polymerase sigma factor [Methylomonas sp. UP202]
MPIAYQYTEAKIRTLNATITDHFIAQLWTEALANDLRTFLTGRVKCPEAAEDLAHETYLRFYKSAHTNLPDNARALAFRIAVNLAIDYQRHCKVKSQILADVDDELLADTVADHAQTDPLRILLSRERFGTMEAALNELSADCRTAFILNKIENLSYAEIAGRLNISQRSVGRLLEQAILHCMLRLDD